MFFSKRRMLFLSIFIILIVLGSIQSASASRAKNSVNIMFITIDTLRPDHLGCYGYNDIKTPNIDRLAKDGVLFTNAYSSVPLTLPSHVSMMTGQYCIQHGVQNNGTFILDDSAKTLAEIFQKSGYKTGAIVASFVLASHFGLNQGFDFYDDHFFKKTDKAQNYSENSRNGEAVTDAAKKWLQKNYKKPFFLWVHYFDPHSPYDPPPPFDETYKDRPYDGDIAYTDQCLGHLLEEMKKLSLLENTYIILVGDHGEGLWEHNEQTHGLFIYDTTLRVPFIICYPELFPKGKKVASLVRTIDIMPTILDSLGIKSKEAIDTPGTSLIPILKGKGNDIKLDLYCESRYSKLNLNWAPLEGIVTFEGWKYIYAPKPELYNLKKDPHEKENLFSTDPQKAKSLQERWESLKKDLLLKSDSQEKAKQIGLSHAAKERLQSLGYIWHSEPSDGELEDQNDHLLPDPKDKAHLLAMIDQARGLEGEGEFDKAIQKYEEVLHEDPDNKMALFSVGMAYTFTGHLKEALSTMQKMTELDPENIDSLNSLGLLYDQLGMPDKAIQAFKEALQVNFKVAHIHYNLGNVYLKLNNFNDAMQEFEEMLSLSKDPVVVSMALGNLGGVYLRKGKLKKALKKFKESIKYNSVNHDAYISLADTYYHIGDIDQSINEWKNIIDLWPDDHVACYNIAQLFIKAKKYDQAAQYLKKSLQIRPDYIDARMLLERIY